MELLRVQVSEPIISISYSNVEIRTTPYLIQQSICFLMSNYDLSCLQGKDDLTLGGRSHSLLQAFSWLLQGSSIRLAFSRALLHSTNPHKTNVQILTVPTYACRQPKGVKADVS